MARVATFNTRAREGSMPDVCWRTWTHALSFQLATVLYYAMHIFSQLF